MFSIDPVLSEEEQNILLLVAVHPGLKHLSNSEISQRLGIPVTRVKTLLHQACVKLGADNRNEAVLLAMRRREVKLSQLLPLDELAEILITLHPEALREMAEQIRQNRMPGAYPEEGKPIVKADRIEPAILTNRERDMLILASRGYTNLEIAGKLTMSTSAVRTFLNRAFKKLGARKKADALQLALKRREICINEVTTWDELEYYLAPLGAGSIEELAVILEEKRRKRPAITGG